jgi:2-aminoadipate transaminase
MTIQTPAPTRTAFGYSARANNAVDQPISYLMMLALTRPELISLAAGFVDYDTLPGSQTDEMLHKILSDPAASRAALQYGRTQGLTELRQLAYNHLAKCDGIDPADYPGNPDCVALTTGSQQMLHILADLLVDPGDIVITAWPSYFVYTGALSVFGATVRSVDLDEDGIIPEKLEALLEKIRAEGNLHRVKMLYTCTHHQNPTGITLSAERRPQLLDIVKKYSTHHRILLLEDNAYRELTYSGEAPVSIKSFDNDNEYVALLHTFSKPFAPGLKTGYGLLPADLCDKAMMLKDGRDFGSANLSQHLLLRALQNGAFEKQVETLCDAYTKKRDAMLGALKEHLGDFMPGETHWTHPTGGLYVWLTLPKSIDTSRHGPLFKRAVELGMLYVPGDYCYPADPTRPEKPDPPELRRPHGRTEPRGRKASRAGDQGCSEVVDR